MNAHAKFIFSEAAGLLALALTVASVSGAPPADQQNQDTSAQIQALQEEVRQLKTEVKALKDQRQPQTQPAAPAEPARIAEDLSRDAQRRSQLLDVSGVSAGWTPDHGFFLASDDGNFLLHPWMMLQVRYAANWRQDAKAGDVEDNENGFEIRRLQFGMDGNVFSPDLTYRIFWQSSEKSGGDLENLMAWVQYRFHDTPWVIGGGQFKDPLYHEQLVADAAQLAVDRTLADEILANGEAFSKGVTIRYDDGGPFRGEGAFTSGIDNNNTNFESFPTNDTFGLAGRVDYKFMGAWKDYTQFSSQGNSADLLVAGAGMDWTEGGHTNAFRHDVDIQYNPGPLGLFAGYLGQYTSGNTANNGGAGGNTYDSSFIFQVSYLIGGHFEPFGRFDYDHFDGKEFKPGTGTTVQEYTAGANYYFRGQQAKLVFDLSYFPKGPPMTDIGDDILANPGHGEYLARVQFQLAL